MKILYVSSEALPFAATGGLGDVAGSLPAAVLHALGDGNDVRVVIPMFPSVKAKFMDQITRECETEVVLSWRHQYLGIWSAVKDGVKFYFLDNEYYFKRATFYGSFDDGERFAYFGKAVLRLMQSVDFYPDILHANDWQSALSVIYLKRQYACIPQFSRMKAVYTIHNIEYQGIYGFDILTDVFDIAPEDRSIVEYNGAVNLTKGAITVADRVTTVSKTYAQEILTPYYAHGLDGILNATREKLSGIVNGIDVDYYNPETDPALCCPYSAKFPAGKAKNKAFLQKKCGFAVDPDIPVIAMVSRLASHKGFDLVCRVIEEILTYDAVQIVLLGTGEQALEAYFASLNEKYRGKFCAMIEFNKDLSKQIYAGADMFLMPSKSEPCGLAQMIASRYGTLAIVRETGGLADTIQPYNRYDQTGNGFSFANYNAHEMLGVIRDAVALFADRKAWNHLVKNAMHTDFSWRASAKKYIELYRSMLNS